MTVKKGDKVRCDACPVMCFVAEGRTGACDRYANMDGKIVRTDPLTVFDKRLETGGEIKPFLQADWEAKPFAATNFLCPPLAQAPHIPTTSQRLLL